MEQKTRTQVAELIGIIAFAMLVPWIATMGIIELSRTILLRSSFLSWLVYSMVLLIPILLATPKELEKIKEILYRNRKANILIYYTAVVASAIFLINRIEISQLSIIELGFFAGTGAIYLALVPLLVLSLLNTDFFNL